MLPPEPPGRIALVTGSRGGIGREIARSLTRSGFQVVGLDASADLDGQAGTELRADITDEAQCQRALAQISRRAGRLDALVCAAGVNMRAPFDSLDLDDARSLFDVNVWGTVNVLRSGRTLLAKSHHASAVVVTSVSGQLGFQDSSVYAMSKMALTGLVKSLAVEWAPVPIRVNAVAPAIVPTAMNANVREIPGYVQAKLSRIPLGRMIEPQEVAAAVDFLAGDRSSGITGHVLNVDGGSMIHG